MSTTYFLDHGGRIILPRTALHLRVDGAGGRVAIDIARHTRPGAVPGRHDRVTIPPITARAVIAAVPGDGAPMFREGARVALFVETDDHGDSEQLAVEVVQQDIGGTHRTELARLTPVGDHVELSVRAPDQLSARARTAFRTAHELLGAGCGPHTAADEITIAIDTTASMAERLGDGCVPALADLIAGVSRAAGSDLRDVRLLGPVADTVAGEPLGTLAERVETIVRDVGVGIGRSTGVPRPGEGRGLVLVVTDAEPVDHLDTAPGIRHLVLNAEPTGSGADRTGIDPAHLTDPAVVDGDSATWRQLVRGLLAALAAES
ncbi:hypothetical protein ACTD5D_21225 [Nocardia takedensis]|uniref:hypothetical protein n=1 Tax=Nocardia takedensis TaxID=259390 RepID=UPI003F75CEA5